MSKYKIFLSLVIIVFSIIYFRPFFQAQSLVELLDGDITAVDSVNVLNLQNGAGSKVDDVNESADFLKLQEILMEADVKRVWNPFSQGDYVVTFYDQHVDFWLTFTRKGTIYIQDDVENGYKFVDEALYAELLDVLEKM